MPKRYLKIIILPILILIFCSNLNVKSIQINNDGFSVLSSGSTIYVDDDNINGPWLGTIDHPYKTINEGFFNSTEGDTIFVLNGTYSENIVIDKRISLIGEGQTIIDGGYNSYVLHLNQDNVVLKNLIFRNSGGFKGNSCILVESENNLIVDCEIYRARRGIYFKNSDNNEIKNSTFYSNGEGMKIYSSKNIEILDSCFNHNAFGTDAQHSDNIKIENCYFHTNGLGILLNETSNINISNCAIYNNNDNQGGMMTYFSNNVTVFNCNFEHSGFGLSMDSSSDLYIRYSDFSYHNHEAFWIKSKLENVNIENCEIYENIRFGAIISNGSCNLRYNNFYNNLFGLYAEKSFCDARENWWNSTFGLSAFELKSKERAFSKFGIIRFIPWLPSKNENAGSNWEIDYNRCPVKINISRFEQITFSENDTDIDGIPDWWEEKWGYNSTSWDDHINLDPDEDALNNFKECYTDKWGSNPFKKDLFIEVDYFESSTGDIYSNRPTEYWIEEMTESFSRHDIALHIDDGRFGGGELIPDIESFYYEDLDDIYWDYFLHNDLNNERKGIFHYCYVRDFGPYPDFSGFSIFGWDHLDSWVLLPDSINQKFSTVSRDLITISVIMHELGHTMGLLADDHGGNDNMVATMIFTKQFFKYSTYRSIMNYMYTYRILDYSDGKLGKNDFDDWGNLDFDFFKNTDFIIPESAD